MYYNIYVYKIFVLFVYKSERKLLKNYKVMSRWGEKLQHMWQPGLIILTIEETAKQ